MKPRPEDIDYYFAAAGFAIMAVGYFEPWELTNAKATFNLGLGMCIAPAFFVIASFLRRKP